MSLHRTGCLVFAVILLIFSPGCGGGGDGDNGNDNGNDGNQAPVIIRADADPGRVWPGAESEVICEATDQDGDLLSYEWEATSGSLTNDTQSTAIWQAPDAIGDYSITCEVSDGRGGKDEAMVAITVALGTVTGQAVDRATGDGVGNVQVALNRIGTVQVVLDETYVAVTGPSGRFTVRNIPAGEYGIIVNTPDGYAVVNAPDTVSVTQPGISVSLPQDIQLYDYTSPTPPPPPPFD